MSNDNEFDDDRPARMIVLPGGICVLEELHDELRRQVEDSIPMLSRSAGIKIQDLVAATFWKPRSRWERIQLGRCLAYWVAKGELGLEFLGCWRCNSKRYMRRDDAVVEPPIKSSADQESDDVQDDPESTEGP